MRAVRGNLGSKMEAMVTAVANVLARDVDAKLIIFCQWSALLAVVDTALKVNGIAAVTAKTASALASALPQFRASPDIKCLVMLLKDGANGINLVEANYVMLVAPISAIGVEQQAVARIHRMGQERETHIIRLISQNTIEETLQAVRDATQNGASQALTGKAAASEKIRVADLRAVLGI